ncbi:7771_t:CDS:2, partial [Scutellospora calospora]
KADKQIMSIGDTDCLVKSDFEVNYNKQYLDTPKEVTDRNIIINILMMDYASHQSYTFVIKAIFPNNNSQFKYLNNFVWSDKSVLFVVGWIEIIQEKLYMYTINISFINVSSAVKRKVFNLKSSQSTLASYRSIQSRFLTIHQNTTKETVKDAKIGSSNQCNKMSRPMIDSTITDFYSNKYVKIDDKKVDHIEHIDFYNKRLFTDNYNKEGMNKRAECERNTVLNNEIMKHSYE